MINSKLMTKIIMLLLDDSINTSKFDYEINDDIYHLSF